MSSHHSIDKKGRLVSNYQMPVIHHEHMKPETVIVPNDGTTSFGSYFTITFREHALILKNMQLQFNVSAITGITSAPTNYPNFNPAFYFFTRIELVLGTVVIDTLYNNQQFLMNQLFKTDEQRALANYACGNYSTSAVASRGTLASSTSNYFVDLFTLFDQNDIPLLFNHTDVQLRVYTDYVINFAQQSTGTGTPVATLNYCNLLAKVIRLKGDVPHKLIAQHQAKPHHYKFTDLRYQTNTIASGTTSTSILLSGFNAQIAVLFFTIRSAVTGANSYEYQPISYFSILDATSTNISGGQNVLSAYSLLVLDKAWTLSSYTTENSLGTTNNYANVYMYSFSNDLLDTIETGKNNGHFKFVGNEQLQINFSSATSSAYQLDIYGLAHSVLKISGGSVEKMDD
jgi:hypothetical protein